MLREIEASGRVVVACRSCGERVVLLGRPGDWHRQDGARGLGASAGGR